MAAALVIVCAVCVIATYGYGSGSCKRQLPHECSDTFCLHKEIDIPLDSLVQGELTELLSDISLQKRVNIESPIEMLFDCALPNKRGITISTKHVEAHCPSVIDFYQTTLRDIISKELGVDVQPTDLSLPTTCAVLIYDQEGDWINWHYDYNYYDGRFFTVLIPITNEPTCTQFQYRTDDNKIKSVDLLNGKSICFEGNYLYHRASKLCKNQRRVVLSCQFVTDNRMSTVNSLRLRLKDFAYIGTLF